jgi:hypothetical protein
VLVKVQRGVLARLHRAHSSRHDLPTAIPSRREASSASVSPTRPRVLNQGGAQQRVGPSIGLRSPLALVAGYRGGPLSSRLVGDARHGTGWTMAQNTPGMSRRRFLGRAGAVAGAAAAVATAGPTGVARASSLAPGPTNSKALLSDYAVGTVDTADSAHLLVTRTSSSPDLEAYVGVSINGPGVTSALHGPTPVRIGDRLVCAGTAEAGRLDASNVQIIYQIVEGQWSMHPTPAVVLPAGRVPISSSTHLRRSDMSPVDSSGMSDGEAVAATARVNQITGDTTLLIVAAHS